MDNLISVIVPIYNGKAYLDRCVESIVNQTYRNLEIILVDDGSTDGSGEMCDEWAAKDGRIKVVHKINGGLGDARNRGLDKASGKYIAFVDCDDTVENTAYETSLKYMLEEKPDIVISAFNVINPNTKDREVMGFDRAFYSLDDWKDKGVDFIDSWCADVAWNKLYLREIIEKNNIRYNITRTIGEDFLFSFRYYEYCEKIRCIPDALYNYYFDGGNLSSKGNTGYYDRMRAESELRTDFASKKGVGGLIAEINKIRYPSKLFFALMFSLAPNEKISLRQRKKDLKLLYTSGEDDVILKKYLKERPGVTGMMLYIMYTLRMSTMMIASIHIFDKIKGRN